MEKRLKEVLDREEGNYILPFFWQHGERRRKAERDDGRCLFYRDKGGLCGIKAASRICRSGLVERYGYYYGRGAEKEYACLGSG